MTARRLTAKQRQALADLRERGSLTPRTDPHSVGGSGRQYTRRTLDALAVAGLARTERHQLDAGSPTTFYYPTATEARP